MFLQKLMEQFLLKLQEYNEAPYVTHLGGKQNVKTHLNGVLKLQAVSPVILSIIKK